MKETQNYILPSGISVYKDDIVYHPIHNRCKVILYNDSFLGKSLDDNFYVQLEECFPLSTIYNDTFDDLK